MEGRTLVDSIQSPASPSDCPIGPIGKADKDIWAWLRQGKDRPYEGPFNYTPDPGFDDLANEATARFQAGGRQWVERPRGPFAWEMASDDANYGWPRGQDYGRRLRCDRRHFHGNLVLGDEVVHLDLLTTLNGGPLSGFHYLQASVGGTPIARGGRWSMCYSGATRHMPMVVDRGNWLLRIEKNYGHLHDTVTLDAASPDAPRIRTWECVESRPPKARVKTGGPRR